MNGIHRAGLWAETSTRANATKHVNFLHLNTAYATASNGLRSAVKFGFQIPPYPFTSRDLTELCSVAGHMTTNTRCCQLISLYALQHGDRNSQMYSKSEQSYCTAMASCGSSRDVHIHGWSIEQGWPWWWVVRCLPSSLIETCFMCLYAAICVNTSK
jgi:hypothetical protein